MEYKAAGVDIDAGNETVRRIRRLARGTFTPGVLSEIGSFGGLFHLDRARYEVAAGTAVALICGDDEHVRPFSSEAHGLSSLARDRKSVV